MSQPNLASMAISLVLLYLFIPCCIGGDNFDSIFSVHKDATPLCPPNYSPDPSYIGCCWGEYQTVTSAPGPDSNMSPGCCYSGQTCNGAPPIMYDWTTNADGQLEVVTGTQNEAQTTYDPPVQETTKPAQPAASSVTAASPAEKTSSQPPSTAPAGPVNQCNEGSNCIIGTGNTQGGGTRLNSEEIAGIVIGAVAAIAGIYGAWYAKRMFDQGKWQRPAWLANPVQNASPMQQPHPSQSTYPYVSEQSDGNHTQGHYGRVEMQA